LTKKEFTLALFKSLFLPSPAIIEETRCSCKGTPIIDSRGDHLTTGCGKDGFRHKTHDNVKLTIAQLARSCGVMTTVEQHGCFKETNPDSNLRPDLSFRNAPNLHDKALVGDISICCPYPSGNLSRRAALMALRASKTMFNVKNTKYRELALSNNLEFIPLIIESTGRLHPTFESFIDSILKDKAQGDLAFLGNLKRFWYAVISCCLQRSLMQSLIQRSEKINGNIDRAVNRNWSSSSATIQRFSYVNTRTRSA
jgi:hypothetical protein